MGFQNPLLLLLLLVLPLLVWEYRRRYARGRASAHVLYTNLGQFARVREPSWKRNLGSGLYLLAVALGIIAVARPQATVPAPDNLAGVMLAIDISRSMRATDIEPDRFTAAKREAQNFIRALPQGAKVGLVSFAGYTTLEAPLTTDHQKVIDQIDTLQMFRRTAIGDGLGESLKAFPLDDKGKPLGPSTVVLLSDGRNNWGSDPLEAAQKAKEMGVIVHTIGLGKRMTEDETQFNNFMAFDEETLRAIAETTGGQYYAAESAKALQDAYRRLGRVVGWKPTLTEVSGMLALLAGLLLASSLVVSNVRRRVV